MNLLMKDFVDVWPYKNSMKERYIVEDAGDCYRIIINNFCEWQQKSGGCTMCNYSQRIKYHATDVLRDEAIRIINEIHNLDKNYNKVKLYINGSFFNENELAKDVAISFLCALKNKCGITFVCVETRPEYLSKSKLLEYITETTVDFEICFGIESTNSIIRNVCLNKGVDINLFYSLCQDIMGLCKIKVYLLIKPPFISENESIQDVVSSVNDLVNHGITAISYTPIAIQKNTLLEFLLQENLYRPVWIWSLIEINTQLASLRQTYPEIHLAGLEYYPEPLQTYFNCEKCSSRLAAMLASNRNITWQDISLEQHCSCYEKWSHQLKSESIQSIDSQILLARESLTKNRKRAQEISHLVSGNFRSYLTDVAKLVPEHNVKLDKVGVEGVRLPLMIHGYQVDGATFTCSLELDEFHRGIHMSRLIEQLNDFSKVEHQDIINDLKILLDTQGQVNNSISLQCQLFKKVQRNLSNKTNFVSISFDCYIQRLCFPRTTWQSNITVTVPFINACPCTKVSAEELFKESFTHTQRGKIRVSFVNTEISFAKVIEFIENYIGIFDLLKREDELYVVGNAHKNSQFCEDICREIANNISAKHELTEGCAIVHVTTEESIHPHQAFSEKRIDFSNNI